MNKIIATLIAGLLAVSVNAFAADAKADAKAAVVTKATDVKTDAKATVEAAKPAVDAKAADAVEAAKPADAAKKVKKSLKDKAEVKAGEAAK